MSAPLVALAFASTTRRGNNAASPTVTIAAKIKAAKIKIGVSPIAARKDRF
jgi:hypothetical protein